MYSNKTTTVLATSPNKTEDSVTADNILTQFHRIVARDHEAKFYHFRDKHATCGAVLLCHYETRYNELVEDGKNLLAGMKEKFFGYDELRRMVNRLEKHKDNYMLFMREYEAPFTNNEAERDLPL